MKIRLAIAAAFGLGLVVGGLGTGSWGPQAAERLRLSVGDIAGFDERVRTLIEECVIAGAGTTLARLTCHLE